MFGRAPVTPIRPNLPPGVGQTQAPQPRPVDPARLAAQRAFFAAAMGQTSASPPAASPAEPATASATRQVEPAAAPSSSGAQRILRPGSLLDIRV